MSFILTPRTLEAVSAILTTAALPSQEVHSSDAFAQPEPTEEPECRFRPSRSSWTCEEVENVPGELPGGESVLAVQPPTPYLLFTPTPHHNLPSERHLSRRYWTDRCFPPAISRPGKLV